MEIKSTSAPGSPRSKRYPAGSTVVNSGSGTTTVTGGGSSVDVLKTTSGMSPSDANVFSSLRSITEIRKHIVVKNDEATELTDTNTFSSLRSIKEIEERALSRLTDDTAAGNIGFKQSITVGKTSTTLNLIVQSLAKTYDLEVDHVATLFHTIIKDYISSETYIPGMLGEGAKLYKSLTGDWNLELDNVTVRKAITTFEMVISKVRAVNGGLVVSSANGKVKSVATTTGDPAYYILGIEGDMTFVSGDLVRCQVYTSGRTKYYWLPIEQINGDSILILKSGFPDGVAPAEGDELVQMGNRTDTGRQGVLYFTASEDGKPRFSVLDGINSPTLAGKNKVILGCLDGITDTDFPADYQPSGYGLCAMNVFLKGLFILRNGKTVDSALSELTTQIEAIPGQISLKVTEEVGKIQLGGRNYYKKNSSVIALYEQPYIDLNRSDCPNGMYLTGTSTGISAARIVGVIDSNGYWTVSFDLRGSQSANLRAFVMDVCDGASVSTHVTSDNDWHHHEYTFYVDRHDAAPNVYNFVDLEYLAWAYIFIRNLKIEKGNKATDWTPAPEDIEYSLTQTGIDITNRKIVATSDKFVVQDNSGNQMAVFENGKIRADRIDAGQILADGINARRIRTGNLEVISGANIAGFNISGSSINSGTMNLSPDNITFCKNSIYAGFGTESGPSVIGLDVPIWVKNESYSDTCIAAHLAARGAYDKFNNIALSLDGCISGYAVRVKQLNNSNNYYTVESEGFVSCYNTQTLNIYLPPNPSVGREITIKRVNNAHVEVYTRQNPDLTHYKIYTDGVYSNIGLTRVGEVHRYVFDGQYWMRAYSIG